MSLEPYQRGNTWWVKGRVEYNGAPIGDYRRESTGASSEAGAKDYIAQVTDRAIKEHLFGSEHVTTFNDALLLYPAKGYMADYLLKIVPHIGSLALADIYPNLVKELGPKIYPDCSTDTWKRQVIAPVSAVINYAHQSGLCPPIKITAYSAHERIAQDKRRGKQSRREKSAGSWEWIDAFQAQASPHLGALVEFMFETGARIGQAVALKHEDLDLAQARVRLDASKGHDAQWVAISPEMVATIANLAHAKTNRQQARNADTHVFGYKDRSGPKSAWATACKRAGIKHLTPHEAGRHGYFTELTIRQDVKPKVAAKAGRWSGAALPQRVYTHVGDEQREIRRKIRGSRVCAISRS